MGLLKPRSGTINLAGNLINSKSPDQRAKMGIGYVPQGRDIIPRLTVKENLLLGLEARQKQVKKAEIPEEIFSLFPVLKTMLSRMGGDLSGGQQQQLAIARALMSRPQLLLLDEPSLGLAPAIVREIFSIIENLRATGVTILLVEQNANLALQIADRGYVLEAGSITLSGAASNLINDERVKKAYLG